MVKLHCWLLQQLNQSSHPRLLSWYDKKQKVVAIKWKHASYQDYDPADSELFKAWARENGHLDSSAQETKDEMKRWKTNFRCALQSAVNVVKSETIVSGNQRKHYKYYKLLDEPDPAKLSRKRQENRNAIKSKKKPKEQRRQYRSRKVNRVRNDSDTTVSDRDPSSSDEFQESDLARPAVVQPYDEDPEPQSWRCNTAEAEEVVDNGYASDGSMHYDTLESANVAMEVEAEISGSDSDYGSCHDDDYETLQSRVWGHCGIIQETPNVVVEKMPNSIELGLQEVKFCNL